MPRRFILLLSALLALAGAETSNAKHGGDREPRAERAGDSSGGARREPDAREVRARDSDNSGSGNRESHDSGGDRSGPSENSGPGSVNSGRDDDSGDDSDDDSGNAENDDGGGGHSVNSGRQPRIVRDARGEEHIDREIVLIVADARAVQDIVRSGYPVLSQETLSAAGYVLVRVRARDAGAGSLEALRRLQPDATVAYNHVYRPNRGEAVSVSATPAAIRAPGNAVAGLVDARVDAAHPMLRNVTIHEAHFEDGLPAATDHATALASVFAARQDRVTLYSASVFTGTGGDTFGASAASIAQALNWLAENGVQAINVSLSGPPNPILESVIRRLSARGHVVVAAVGNDGPSRTVRYPAAYPEAVAVTAVDAGHAIYRYANRGPEVDFSALGVGLTVAAHGGGAQSVSGTSFAAPIVTLAIARSAGPSGGALRAKEILRTHAADLGTPGPDPVFGWGLIGDDEIVAAGAVARP